jgi:hypothetical protein
MTDFQDRITRVAEDSNILRIYPNVLVQIYLSGTATLVYEGTSDSDGNFTVPTLATGKYDIRIDGQVVHTFHHVTTTHTHSADRTWTFKKLAAITGDQDEDKSMEVYGSSVAGSIVSISVMAENVDATGDIIVHILKGVGNGASALTYASNSVWQYRIHPIAAKKRFFYEDLAPNIVVSGNDTLTLGIDYTATTVEGLTVVAIFRPN